MGDPIQMLDKMFADSRNPHTPVLTVISRQMFHYFGQHFFFFYSFALVNDNACDRNTGMFRYNNILSNIGTPDWEKKHCQHGYPSFLRFFPIVLTKHEKYALTYNNNNFFPKRLIAFLNLSKKMNTWR
jgi:hypothetical protein